MDSRSEEMGLPETPDMDMGEDFDAITYTADFDTGFDSGDMNLDDAFSIG